MEKITKTYVQKVYPGIMRSDTYVSEVEDRDPLKIENNGDMLCFRFFDKEIIKDKNKTYISDEINSSNWFFFGTRLTENDIKLLLGESKKCRIILRRMKEDGYKYICHTDFDTFLPMEEGDTTMNEYIFEKTKKLKK